MSLRQLALSLTPDDSLVRITSYGVTVDQKMSGTTSGICRGRPCAFSPLNTHTHTRLTALYPGLPGWAGTRKVKPIWILLEQETVSGSGISWAICKSASRSRQITMPAPHYSSFFTGWMPFLPPNQQCQSTEGIPLWNVLNNYYTKMKCCE